MAHSGGSTLSCNECDKWADRIEVPDKLIILVCPKCGTEYTYYPSGQIAFTEKQTFGGSR